MRTKAATLSVIASVRRLLEPCLAGEEVDLSALGLAFEPFGGGPLAMEGEVVVVNGIASSSCAWHLLCTRGALTRSRDARGRSIMKQVHQAEFK